MSRSNFSKFVRVKQTKNKSKIIYTLNDEFIKNLIEFLMIKNKVEAAYKIEKYWQATKETYKIPKFKDKIDDLEQKLEIVSRHYEGLLKRYKEILETNKKFEISYVQILNLCNEPAENVAILDLQNKIKEKLK